MTHVWRYIFRISDLDYGSKQICYMVDAPYVGRIVTKHDYKNFGGDIYFTNNPIDGLR